MKKLNIALIVIIGVLIPVIISGCGSFSFPQELIEKPKTEYKSDLVEEIVNALPAKYELILPKDITDTGAINFVDIDGDGKEEVILIYEQKDKIFDIGFMILKEIDNIWKEFDTIKGTGRELIDAQFVDLNNDNKSEVIIQWDSGNKEKNQREIDIYTLEDSKMRKIFGKEYLNIEVDDLDKDGTLDIFLFDYDSDNYKLKVEMYYLNNLELQFVNAVELPSDYKGYMNLIIGNASSNARGIFLDMPIGTHSGYTELLVKENGKLKNVFTGKDSDGVTQRASLINSQDIDNDGIIEIGILSKQKGFDDLSNNEDPWMQQWYSWDGKDNLLYEKDVFYDFSYSFIFNVPDEWKGKYVIEKNYRKEEKNIFFYNRTGYPKDKKEFFRICIISNENWDEFKKRIKEAGRNFIYLEKNERYTFIAYKNMLEEYIDKDMIIDDEKIHEEFQIIR